MNKTVIVVAGGSGNRMQAEIPKQFLLLKNKPILMHTLEAFFNYHSSIKLILVIPKAHFELWNQLCSKYHFELKHELVAGGETRFQSVKNGLSTISSDGLVAIHDGVRPLVSKQTIENCFIKASEKGNAIPVIDINDSLREISENGSKKANRENIKITQTPQVFRINEIKDAYKQDFKEYFTDDASLFDELAKEIYLVDGNRENIKITTQTDLVIAEVLMS